MFPFMTYNGCNSQSHSPKAHKERKLKFLKWMRDDLETRLAGLNAAISTLESQLEREETT
ncbi:conserved hypothetical protein [Hyella patelloides LEGE 07179]|uniref:Uncharacterized protein n=1 Tax=Hyella patelloides LEGE 07179 TaxID=945734 RepID=A0A563W2E3_9CYAN|nr:hypothetical protein [Hyella patelloides]VEP17862.1 conserved hypothetical protein [Hyella patelloides LEGE 07179]